MTKQTGLTGAIVIRHKRGLGREEEEEEEEIGEFMGRGIGYSVQSTTGVGG